MAIYRCNFLSFDGNIETFEAFECSSDDAARAHAAERLMARDFPTVELWQRSRRVFPVAAAPPRQLRLVCKG